MVAQSTISLFAGEEPEVMCQIVRLVFLKRKANNRALNSVRDTKGQALNAFWTASERNGIQATRHTLETVCTKHNVGQVHANRLIVQVDQVRDDNEFEELMNHFSSN